MENEIEKIKAEFLEIIDPHIALVLSEVTDRTSLEFDRCYTPNFVREFGEAERGMMQQVVSDGPIDTVHLALPKWIEVVWKHKGFILYLDYFPGSLERHLCGKMIYRKAKTTTPSQDEIGRVIHPHPLSTQ